MNWLDVALIALGVLFVGSGARHGFSRSGFGLIAVVGAFLFAAWLQPVNPGAFLALFVGFICASAAAGYLLGRPLRKADPPWLDGVLGGLLGALNVVVLLVVGALLVWTWEPPLARRALERSAFAPYAFEAASFATHAVPEEMKTRIESSWENLGKAAPRCWRKSKASPHRNEI